MWCVCVELEKRAQEAPGVNLSHQISRPSWRGQHRCVSGVVTRMSRDVLVAWWHVDCVMCCFNLEMKHYVCNITSGIFVEK